HHLPHSFPTRRSSDLPTCRKLLVVPSEPGVVKPITAPEAKAPAPPEPLTPRQPLSVEIWGKRLTWPSLRTLPSQIVITPSMVAVDRKSTRLNSSHSQI